MHGHQQMLLTEMSVHITISRIKTFNLSKEGGGFCLDTQTLDLCKSSNFTQLFAKTRNFYTLFMRNF